ncbi:MAG: phosphoribosylamine--glycine ligase [Pseudomonadota bacterium]
MNILILGGGAREHALAWAVKQNPKCGRLIVAPGNAGTAAIAWNAELDIEDGEAVAAFAQEQTVDFVIIGPEAPLAAGVADALRDAGIACFGPGKAAAALEASKAFTKEICEAASIPTAAARTFESLDAALTHVATAPLPLVVKADGLAAGKGVIIAETREAARAAVIALFTPGAPLLIEEFMQGEEASFFVLCDGETALPIGTAQDHKRAFDGDQGPNTGGMGAYSPAPIMTPGVEAHALTEIIEPTLAEMARRGTAYHGVLYAGLMIEDGAPRLVEYNVRFGDPECQVLMMRLGGQVLDLLLAASHGTLSEMQVNWADDHALTVVLATKGYPGASEHGSEIKGLDALAATSSEAVFHAATRATQGKITAHGGRVLSATARSATLEDAHQRAYTLTRKIDWPEGFHRQDIAWRALNP